MTIVPSLYGDSKLVFKEDTDVILELDKDRYHQTIARIVIEESAKSRPILVYFQSNEELLAFRNGQYGKDLTVHIVNEQTKNIQHFVDGATDAGRITLLVKVFGRGLNFISRSLEVDNAGGVLVIQTFFSEFESEEKQIKNRTARQTKYGSYKLILLRDNLIDQFQSVALLTPAIVEEESKKSTFYAWLKGLRSQLTASLVQSLRDGASAAQPLHTKSMQFLQLIQARTPNRAEIVNMMSCFVPVATSKFVHVIFCLDESGSMSGTRWEALKLAFREFLSIRRDVGGSAGDKISVIQFDNTARIVLNRASLEVAYNHVLICNGGGTNFIPALEAVKQQILSSSTSENLDTVVVFMSDGECTESNSAVIKAARDFTTATCSGLIQFFAVPLSLDSKCDRLMDLTSAVGGTIVSAGELKELKEKFQLIARQVSASYSRP